MMARIDSYYEDKKIVIDASNMAAGATVYSPWYDGLQWVRNMVFLTGSDQQYDLFLQRRDSALTEDYVGTIFSNQAGHTGWKPTLSIGAAALCGYSCRFGIKNSSAVSNTYGRVRVQLLGL